MGAAPHRRGRRWQPLLAAALALVCCSACTAAGADKAGGSTEVELTFANSAAHLDSEPALQAFLDEVARRSDGRVRIRVLDNFGGEGPDVEQRLLARVAAGKADLGWVGTRVLDTVGVHTFEALTAPFLIDSYPLQRAVFASGLPDTMLPALGDAGVTGLAVVAGGLRRPVSVRAPLATLDAWRGITFETFRSTWQMAAIAALGATPTDIVRNDLARALQDGTVAGAEKSLVVYARNDYGPLAPYVVDDVVLWPETSVLFADPRLRHRLTDRQWSWLRDAATSAARSAPELADADQDLVAELCTAGTRFTSAGPAVVQQLADAEAPVYARLQSDPRTAAAITRIRRLAEGLPRAGPLEVSDTCREAATARVLPGSGGAADGSLIGTWQTDPIPLERLRAAYLSAGGTAAGADELIAQLHTGTAVRFRIEITDRNWTVYDVGDDGVPVLRWIDAYTADGGTLHDVEVRYGCRTDYGVDRTGDSLTVRVLREGGDPKLCDAADVALRRAVFETAPFPRQP